MQMLKNAGLKGRWAFELFGLAWPARQPTKALVPAGLVGNGVGCEDLVQRVKMESGAFTGHDTHH